MTTVPDSIEVIYVAFQAYGEEPLDRFLRSYGAHPAGVPHRLTVALKGFDDPADREAAVARIDRVGGATVDVPDRGFDIGTYLRVAAISRADTVCFLNSNSEILGDRWLDKLVTALRQQKGGAVAATASLESHSGDQMRVLPGQSYHGKRRLTRFLKLLPRFAWFPNPHLRTNALAIDRAELLGFGFAEPRDKDEAWQFESGRAGLSARLLKAGAAVRVVGRDGRAFSPLQWASSGTFWQGGQDNLLVADNQTRRFDQADHPLRARLHELAWQRPSLELGEMSVWRRFYRRAPS